jgi:hypothetical protein
LDKVMYVATGRVGREFMFWMCGAHNVDHADR